MTMDDAIQCLCFFFFFSLLVDEASLGYILRYVE